MMQNGKTAVVTGASGGFGQAIARRLAADGHPLVLLGRHGDIEGLAEELRATGATVWIERPDLADGDAVIAAGRRILAEAGSIHILVNNAGLAVRRPGGPVLLDDMTLTEWNHAVAVNLSAAFLLTQQFAPGMRDKGWGRIVNISSRAGRTGMEAGDVAYAVTKAGLIGLTRKAAYELAPHGITVNAIAAGRFDAGMAMETDPAVASRTLAAIPAGRAGDVRELAATVAFLVSDGAAYMTGAVLDVNGGTFMG
ncbi:SDR family NAD(P)-dependent oxidoreductase [Sphingomonas naphthae]|uniref:SDR family NAD(P)-dependent oxidoreductase n=1 Tax=Sphingomonas naphthae TaxID=1813468 RepID=A0ABY7TGB3_9SPHN|nr:SDR family NAD(P)-dependent oxidoreductase [Sphingomonas naphthae]WCT72184.1 SDR family NAD(P)-dependent oxidoreductase [Sphingomonas naphthae]